MDITLHTFRQYQRQFADFFECYGVDRVILCGDTPPTNHKLLPPRLRRCRFCGRDRSQTTFKKRAHLLPQLLGNKDVLSDSECDACNEVFSKCESDLANFIGISRTLYGVQAKESIPTFKSADRLVTARAGELLGIKAGVRIERDALAQDAIRVLDELGRTEITMLKQPYVPIRVYKAFLKMALAILPTEEVANYALAAEMLLSEVHDEEYGTFCTVLQHQLPSNHHAPFPHCFLFRKLDPQSRRVTHQFYLRYQNMVFSVPLPLHRLDVAMGLYHETLVSRLCPPLLAYAVSPDAGGCTTRVRNFAGREPVREEEVLTLEGAPYAMSQTVALDLKTGLPSPGAFDPSEIIGIFLAPKGSFITPPPTEIIE